MAIITISRGSFAGGRAVAEQVSQRLGYPALSREQVVLQAAEQYGIAEYELTRALNQSHRDLDLYLGERNYVMVGEVEGIPHGFDLDCPAMLELVRHAARLGAPVQLHCSTNDSPTGEHMRQALHVARFHRYVFEQLAAAKRLPVLQMLPQRLVDAARAEESPLAALDGAVEIPRAHELSGPRLHERVQAFV